ncbi:fasciclin domain-containing protein [Sphingobacterium humi]|uniref:FAS1 domain-containing protein n=1 Tax=Sphingobacterium humi TaxID=1796905 RepID=A0A6N8L482_9SPHI|nr:fasciclin domain-containing protein [Sphingobacterium humi]MVZ62582.1 hypothetical protein [Sphingobacterium humi]
MRNLKVKHLNSCLAVFILLMLLLSQCKPAEDVFQIVDYNKLNHVLANNYNLSTFYAGLNRTAYKSWLNSDSSYVVFVPNDLAFSSIELDKNELTALSGTKIGDIIKRHILDDYIDLNSLPYFTKFKFYSKDNSILYISRWLKNEQTFFTINGAIARGKPLNATNGQVYILDRVLNSESYSSIFEVLADSETTTFFLYAVQCAGLEKWVRENNNMTCFAPSNEGMFNIGLTSFEVIKRVDPELLKSFILGHFYNNFLLLSDLSFTLNLSYKEGISFVDTKGQSLALDGYEGLVSFIMENQKKISIKYQEGIHKSLLINQSFLLPNGGTQVKIDVLKRDIICQNGIVHLVDIPLLYM